MDLRVVEVLMTQTPPSSEISREGVDTVAAFLSNMFTPRALTTIIQHIKTVELA